VPRNHLRVAHEARRREGEVHVDGEHLLRVLVAHEVPHRGALLRRHHDAVRAGDGNRRRPRLERGRAVAARAGREGSELRGVGRRESVRGAEGFHGRRARDREDMNGLRGARNP
jgi:hypothetical protein